MALASELADELRVWPSPVSESDFALAGSNACALSGDARRTATGARTDAMAFLDRIMKGIIRPLAAHPAARVPLELPPSRQALSGTRGEANAGHAPHRQIYAGTALWAASLHRDQEAFASITLTAAWRFSIIRMRDASSVLIRV